MLCYLYIYICTGIFLYFLISWLFQMGSHWPHWTAKRSLCALAVSNGGGRTSPVSFSSNDCFEWVLIDGMETCSCHFFVKQFEMGGRGGRGRTLAKVGSSARFELISSFALASQSSFVSINRNERPISHILSTFHNTSAWRQRKLVK